MRMSSGFAVCCLLLSGCNAGDDGADWDRASAFPMGLAVASPFEMVETESVASTALTAGHVSGYVWITARIDAILSGATPLSGAFEPELFFSQSHDALCFGPRLVYENHPDGADAAPDAMTGYPTLPSGDVGLWTETDSRTGEGCSAAEVDSRLLGVRDQVMSALQSVASLVSAAVASGYGWPAAGVSYDLTADMNAAGIPDVTFAQASLGHPLARDWEYLLDFTYAPSGSSHHIVASLYHQSGTGSAYEGVLSYRVSGDSSDFPGSNCALPERTLNGSLKYARDPGNQVRYQSRVATACGTDADAIIDDSADPADGLVDPDTARWSENFGLFAADFKPASMIGSYAYVWQAGAGDPNTRVLDVTVSAGSPLSATAFYGYGPQIGSTVGTVSSFVCNWTAPGSTHTTHDVAQRQDLALDTTTGLFTSSAAQIAYAPTNSCDYDGSGSFVWDHDIDYDVTDEVHAAATADLFTTDLDGDGVADAATIGEAIEMSGFVPPDAPGEWPGTP